MQEYLFRSLRAFPLRNVTKQRLVFQKITEGPDPLQGIMITKVKYGPQKGQSYLKVMSHKSSRSPKGRLKGHGHKIDNKRGRFSSDKNSSENDHFPDRKIYTSTMDTSPFLQGDLRGLDYSESRNKLTTYLNVIRIKYIICLPCPYC